MSARWPERLYAEDIAAIREVSIQRARKILADLEKSSPRAVWRDGMRRFTTRRAFQGRNEAAGDERVDQMAGLVDAVRAEGQATSDRLDSLARQVSDLARRLSAVERRSR